MRGASAKTHWILEYFKGSKILLKAYPRFAIQYNRVVDLALNQAAKPWFHQYLDPAWYHLWRIVSEDV